MINNLKVGDKVKFESDRCRYTVMSASKRYAICTRRFMKTVMFTIIDFDKQIRGVDNLLFGMVYETKEQCDYNLDMLVNGEMEISKRNFISLDIYYINNNSIYNK